MKYTTQEILDWAERHGIQTANEPDIHCAFEDAATFYLTKQPASQAVAAPTVSACIEIGRHEENAAAMMQLTEDEICSWLKDNEKYFQRATDAATAALMARNTQLESYWQSDAGVIRGLRAELALLHESHDALCHENKMFLEDIQKLSSESTTLRSDLTLLREVNDGLERECEGLRKDKARLHWLHACNGVNDKDAEGYEWGIYRVKLDQHGQNPDVQATFSDFSDLDAAMENESAAAAAKEES